MLVKTFGSAVYGVEAITITIEVNEMSGADYYIVGLPDSAVKESLQRVESALKTNNYFMPRRKLVVNLAPADIKKTGSAFDLAIAVGTLAASEQLLNPDKAKRLCDHGRAEPRWHHSTHQRRLTHCYNHPEGRVQRPAYCQTEFQRGGHR